jgi:hypothetical protein
MVNSRFFLGEAFFAGAAFFFALAGRLLTAVLTMVATTAA